MCHYYFIIVTIIKIIVIINCFALYGPFDWNNNILSYLILYQYVGYSKKCNAHIWVCGCWVLFFVPAVVEGALGLPLSVCTSIYVRPSVRTSQSLYPFSKFSLLQPNIMKLIQNTKTLNQLQLWTKEDNSNLKKIIINYNYGQRKINLILKNKF